MTTPRRSGLPVGRSQNPTSASSRSRRADLEGAWRQTLGVGRFRPAPPPLDPVNPGFIILSNFSSAAARARIAAKLFFAKFWQEKAMRSLLVICILIGL